MTVLGPIKLTDTQLSSEIMINIKEDVEASVLPHISVYYVRSKSGVWNIVGESHFNLNAITLSVLVIDR